MFPSYSLFLLQASVPERICSWTVAVQTHNKVITSAITFCNSQTLIQSCLICVMVYECGLRQGIMLGNGLSVEMKICG
jgi:hypothetical protein